MQRVVIFNAGAQATVASDRRRCCRAWVVPTQMRPLPPRLTSSVPLNAVRRQSVLPLRVAAAALDPLEPWQAVRLHEEFEKGRRKVKVAQVSKELQMDREEVIMWMKEFAGMSQGRRNSLKEAAVAARDANKERRRLLKEELQAEKLEEAKPSFAERQAAGGDFAKKRLSKAARDTLETVWTKTRWPDDEIVRSIYKLHRVPRHKTLAWFAEKRASEPHQERERRKDANNKRFMNKNFKDNDQAQ